MRIHHMKKMILFFAIMVMMPVLSFAKDGAAIKLKKNKSNKITATTPVKKIETKAKAESSSTGSGAAEQQLAQALSMVRAGQLEEGAIRLHNLSRRTDLQKYKMQIKYILGNTLLQLKLNQVAAFQFVDVIKNGNSQYVKSSIEQLSIAADSLGDDTLLNYATSKVSLDEFPKDKKDLITFRMAEVKLRTKQYKDAIALFTKIGPESRYYWSAYYKRGLAYAEAGQPKEAVRNFNSLVEARASYPVTDTIKVSAQMGMARAYYQGKDWDKSIEAYREIPRDHEFWHDALFESSWALLMAGRLRSTLSQFQSLHSPYYLDSYNPESLILRGIVYLYICQYDEMEKTLQLFEKTYSPVRTKISEFLNQNSDPLKFYAELEKSWYERRGKLKNPKTYLPKKVLYKLLDESDIRRAFSYLLQLAEEKNRLDKMQVLSRSNLGGTAKTIVNNRMKNAKILIGEMMKSHMNNMKASIADFYEQASFLNYEVINGKKETLRKRIAGKNLPANLNTQNDRQFYIQNGYEYWPFEGEYWLDEIGNYQYLGQSSCE
jgi:tetratricopeptide (TPR) repeat protein